MRDTTINKFWRLASCALINSVLYRVKTVGNSLSPVTMA